MGLAAEAQATEDWGRKLELIQVFDRCFFSVRVAVALQLRLRREARLGESPHVEPADVERAEGLEIERPERGAAEPAYDERDRDREVERATLPLLLSTLNDVATAAGALPGPPPAALPSLRELLARVGAETPATPTPETSPARSPMATPRASLLLAGARPALTPATPLRARLAGSAGAALEVGPLRRATGPPRRR